VQVGVGSPLALEAGRGDDGIGAGLVVDVQVGTAAPLAVEAGWAIDGVGTDSAEVTGRC
jgi:hypothetical protein